MIGVGAWKWRKRACIYMHSCYQSRTWHIHIYTGSRSPTTYLSVLASAAAIVSKILLSINNHPLLLPQDIFKHWIAASEWDSVVSTLHNQIDLIEESAHFLEAGGMVAEVVGAWEGGEGWEDGAGDEWGGHYCDGTLTPSRG